VPDISEAQTWINLANRDHIVATHLKETLKPMPVEVVCFHCQQTVEKALKAVLAYYEDEIPKTHNIRLLAELCSKHNKEILIDNNIVDTITDYAVITRYVEDRRDYTEDTANFALNQASKTIENVKQALNLSES
jgi:HEPN domain-containing protein